MGKRNSAKRKATSIRTRAKKEGRGSMGALEPPTTRAEVEEWLSKIETAAEAEASAPTNSQAAFESKADANAVLQILPELRNCLVDHNAIHLAWLALRVGSADARLSMNKMAYHAAGSKDGLEKARSEKRAAAAANQHWILQSYDAFLKKDPGNMKAARAKALRAFKDEFPKVPAPQPATIERWAAKRGRSSKKTK